MALLTNKSIISFLTETNQTCPQMTSALKNIGNGSMKNGINTLYQAGVLEGRAEGMIISGVVTLGLGFAVKKYSDYKQKILIEQAKEAQEKEIEENTSTNDINSAIKTLMNDL